MISELKAMIALLENGWDVSRPVLRESHDIEAVNPKTGVKVRIQVKTARPRDDREGSPLVVYAKKRDGKPYTERDCEYFIGVHGDDVYLFANRRKTEYWRSKKPKPGYGWTLLSGSKAK